MFAAHFALCNEDIYNLGYMSALGEMFSTGQHKKWLHKLFKSTFHEEMKICIQE